MTQTIINLGTGGAALNGRNGSTSGLDSNDALFLNWPGGNGGNYVYLPGVAGNRLSVPDEAALDITGDIDVRAQVALDSWSSSTTLAIVTKMNAVGQRSFSLFLNNANRLRFDWTSNGTALNSAVANADAGFIDGEVKWVRATLDVDNGTGGRDVRFFVSDNGSTWVQVGTTITQAGTTSIFSSTSDLVIGAFELTGTPLPAKVYRAQVLNGIDGTNVLDIDTSVITSGTTTSFTALTGQTVTVARSTAGRKTVAVVSPLWLFGTDDYMEVQPNSLIEVDENTDATFIFVCRVWDTPLSSQTYLSKRNSVSGVTPTTPGYWLRSRTTEGRFDFIADDGTNILGTVLPVSDFVSGRLDVASVVIDRTAGTQTIRRENASGTGVINYGSLSSPLRTLRIGRTVTGTALYADMELLAVAIFRRALSPNDLAELTAYYQSRLS